MQSPAHSCLQLKALWKDCFPINKVNISHFDVSKIQIIDIFTCENPEPLSNSQREYVVYYTDVKETDTAPWQNDLRGSTSVIQPR